MSDNDNVRPTEEIYLELEDLQEAAQDLGDEAPDEPAPVTSEDDPTGIKARIAKLRAMLADRGAPLDE
jgi:hypothetical protein